MDKAFVEQAVEKLNAFFKENINIIGFKLEGSTYHFDRTRQGWFSWENTPSTAYIAVESHYGSNRVKPCESLNAKLCVCVTRPGLWMSFDEYVNVEVFERSDIVFIDVNGQEVTPVGLKKKEKQVTLPLGFFKDLFYDHVQDSECYTDMLRLRTFAYIVKNDPTMEEHFPLDEFEKKHLQTYELFEKNPKMKGFEYKGERYTLNRRPNWEHTVCYDYDTKIWFDNNLRTMKVDASLNHERNLRHKAGEQFPNHTQDLGIEVISPAGQRLYFRMSEFLSPETKYF